MKQETCFLGECWPAPRLSLGQGNMHSGINESLHICMGGGFILSRSIEVQGIRKRLRMLQFVATGVGSVLEYLHASLDSRRL